MLTYLESLKEGESDFGKRILIRMGLDVLALGVRGVLLNCDTVFFFVGESNISSLLNPKRYPGA